MQPISVDQISDEVFTIKWDDDHESIYFAAHLRKKCPCAICANEKKDDQSGPFKILKTKVGDVKIVSWEMIGRYAIGFEFSDGHKTGIYSYETMRGLCQCDLCDDNVIRIQGPLK